MHLRCKNVTEYTKDAEMLLNTQKKQIVTEYTKDVKMLLDTQKMPKLFLNHAFLTILYQLIYIVT